MALEIQNVRFSWTDKELLKGVSLSLAPGEFAGFLGPNGSGKSTFLKNILGFLKPQGGKVLYADGANPSGCTHTEYHAGVHAGGSGISAGIPATLRELTTKEKARRFSFVPQASAFGAPFSVAELALMGRLPHLRDRWAGYTENDRSIAEAALETMGLTALANRAAPSLSGGELQKAVIARCLAQEGEVILLDEATSGLDLNHAIEVMELMRKKASEEKKIVLAVLHDLNLAAQYCDRVLLLKEGELRYQGKPSEVLTEAVIEDVYGIRAVVHTDGQGRPYILPRRVAAADTAPAADMAESAAHNGGNNV